MVKLRVLIYFVLAAWFLAACSAQQTPIVTEESAVPPATPTLLPQPSPVVDYCLDCHTDKDKLVALAKEEDAGHGSESEGVG
ncbi:MAG: hypothetical protein DDG60_15835 [Anaerolineae bacterium]|nr:MAG: hypothetical protein DDG60_15835 [Anaerolineae bacterium]